MRSRRSKCRRGRASCRSLRICSRSTQASCSLSCCTCTLAPPTPLSGSNASPALRRCCTSTPSTASAPCCATFRSPLLSRRSSPRRRRRPPWPPSTWPTSCSPSYLTYTARSSCARASFMRSTLCAPPLLPRRHQPPAAERAKRCLHRVAKRPRRLRAGGKPVAFVTPQAVAARALRLVRPQQRWVAHARKWRARCFQRGQLASGRRSLLPTHGSPARSPRVRVL
mmetsp:Transcript_52030/g.116818  ORF Transcript_52030/g.116818 Transcript_52030/m.116818 type:complete len:225 (+) Transcript_52030:1474-2148(+)